MNDKMMKMLAKKKDLLPSHKKAKMDVVKDLKAAASEAMGDKMDGLKKVSVMSNSKEGLQAGLDKARGIVSGHEMDQMKDHAENDMGDYKSALDEHMNDEPNQEEGWMNDENRYADGGPVVDPSKAQSAQDSMRDAFHFNEGGEVDSMDDEGEELSPDQGEYSSEDQEAPSEHEDESDEDDEFQGLDMSELDAKIKKLMKKRQMMESKE